MVGVSLELEGCDWKKIVFIGIKNIKKSGDLPTDGSTFPLTGHLVDTG
jgi:hypothetical protein